MYYYFVSYALSDNSVTKNCSFDWCCIKRDKPITTIEDIKEITKDISDMHKLHSSKVAIISFQLLRKEPDTE